MEENEKNNDDNFPRHELLFLIADYLERHVGFSSGAMTAIHDELATRQLLGTFSNWDGRLCAKTARNYRENFRGLASNHLELILKRLLSPNLPGSTRGATSLLQGNFALPAPALNQERVRHLQPEASGVLGQSSSSIPRVFSADNSVNHHLGVDESIHSTKQQSLMKTQSRCLLTRELGMIGKRRIVEMINSQELRQLMLLKTQKTVQGHCAFVYCIAVSPNGRLVATGSDDHQVKLWSSTTGRLLHTYRGHTNHVCDIEFDNSGTLLVTGSDDKTVRLWEVSSSRCLYTFKGHTEGVERVLFDPLDCNIVSTSNDGSCGVWDVKKAVESIGMNLVPSQSSWKLTSADASGALFVPGERVSAISLPHVGLDGKTLDVNCLSVHPLGGVTATGAKDGHIRIWLTSTKIPDSFQAVSQPLNIESKKLKSVKSFAKGFKRLVALLRSNHGSISHISWSSDGSRLLSGFSEGSTLVWFVPKHSIAPMQLVQVSGSMPVVRTLNACTFYGNRAVRLELKSTTVTLRSQGQRKTSKLQAVNATLDFCCWNSDESRIITGQSLPRPRTLPNGSPLQVTFWDQQTKVWDARSGRLVRTLRGHREKSYVAQAHPSLCDVVATASQDGQVIVWDIRKGVKLSCLLATDVAGVAMVLDMRWIPQAGAACDLVFSDSIGRISFVGSGSGSSFDVAYPEQYFQSDFQDITLDAFSNVVITATQLPPHRSSPGLLCDAARQPHRLQPPDDRAAIFGLRPMVKNSEPVEFELTRCARAETIARMEQEREMQARNSLRVVTPSYMAHDEASEKLANNIRVAAESAWATKQLSPELCRALGFSDGVLRDENFVDPRISKPSCQEVTNCSTGDSQETQQPPTTTPPSQNNRPVGNSSATLPTSSIEPEVPQRVNRSDRGHSASSSEVVANGRPVAAHAPNRASSGKSGNENQKATCSGEPVAKEVTVCDPGEPMENSDSTNSRPSRRAARKALLKVKEVIGSETENSTVARQTNPSAGSTNVPAPSFNVEDGEWVAGEDVEEEGDLAPFQLHGNAKKHADKIPISSQFQIAASRKQITPKPPSFMNSRTPNQSQLKPVLVMNQGSKRSKKKVIHTDFFQSSDGLEFSEEFLYPQVGDEFVYFTHGHLEYLGTNGRGAGPTQDEVPLMNLKNIPAVLCTLVDAKPFYGEREFEMRWTFQICRVPWCLELLRQVYMNKTILAPTDRWLRIKLDSSFEPRLPDSTPLPYSGLFEIRWGSLNKKPPFLVPRLQYDQSILQMWTLGDIIHLDQSIHGGYEAWKQYRVVAICPETKYSKSNRDSSPWNCLQVEPIAQSADEAPTEKQSILVHYWSGINDKVFGKNGRVHFREPRKLVLSNALSVDKRRKTFVRLQKTFGVNPWRWTELVLHHLSNIVGPQAKQTDFRVHPTLIFRRLASEFYRSDQGHRHDLESFASEIRSKWPNDQRVATFVVKMLNGRLPHAPGNGEWVQNRVERSSAAKKLPAPGAPTAGSLAGAGKRKYNQRANSSLASKRRSVAGASQVGSHLHAASVLSTPASGHQNPSRATSRSPSTTASRTSRKPVVPAFQKRNVVLSAEETTQMSAGELPHLAQLATPHPPSPVVRSSVPPRRLDFAGRFETQSHVVSSLPLHNFSAPKPLSSGQRSQTGQVQETTSQHSQPRHPRHMGQNQETVAQYSQPRHPSHIGQNQEIVAQYSQPRHPSHIGQNQETIAQYSQPRHLSHIGQNQETIAQCSQTRHPSHIGQNQETIAQCSQPRHRSHMDQTQETAAQYPQGGLSLLSLEPTYQVRNGCGATRTRETMLQGGNRFLRERHVVHGGQSQYASLPEGSAGASRVHLQQVNQLPLYSSTQPPSFSTKQNQIIQQLPTKMNQRSSPHAMQVHPQHRGLSMQQYQSQTPNYGVSLHAHNQIMPMKLHNHSLEYEQRISQGKPE